MRRLLLAAAAATTICLPSLCFGLANNNPISKLLKKSPFGPSEVEDNQGISLLKSLDLEADIEPKSFSARPGQLPALFFASLPAIFRFGSGIFADGYRVGLEARNELDYSILRLGDYQSSESDGSDSGRKSYLKQKEPLVIYEFETCPFCRKVREAVSMLSLTVTFLPCPKDGREYRKPIKSQYGQQATFPYMEDPNTGVKMFESDQIIEYLFKTYSSKQKVPWTLSSSPWVPVTAGAGLIWRGGGSWKPAVLPPEPLVLWSYEGSPFCKLVREKLSELEIAHTQISCPRGSPNRQRLYEEQGFFQVPFLEDPNTGVDLFESEAIVEYLEKQYQIPETNVKYL